MSADGCPWNTWQTRIQVPKSLRIRYLYEPAVENGGFESRKRSNLTKVGGAENKVGWASFKIRPRTV